MTNRMNSSKQKILWLDCLGALVVGVIVLVICRPLSRWDGLPVSMIVTIGFVNLIYGTYSLYVTTRDPRPLGLVTILALANMAWLLVCIAIIALNWERITLFGLMHVFGEGVYVAGLGYSEWKLRHSLGVSSTATAAAAR